MTVPSWSFHTRVAQTQIYSRFLFQAHDDYSDVATNAAYWDDPHFIGSSFFLWGPSKSKLQNRQKLLGEVSEG